MAKKKKSTFNVLSDIAYKLGRVGRLIVSTLFSFGMVKAAINSMYVDDVSNILICIAFALGGTIYLIAYDLIYKE